MCWGLLLCRVAVSIRIRGWVLARISEFDAHGRRRTPKWAYRPRAECAALNGGSVFWAAQVRVAEAGAFFLNVNIFVR